MRRVLLAAALAATTLIPALSVAQPVRQDQRELRQDQRHARRDGVVTGQERRELRSDQRQLNHARQVQQVQRWNRADRNWWRQRTEFHGFAGRRPGFWFVPGSGYVRVEPRWAGYRWARGVVAPPAYRGYVVGDPGFYGLRPAGWGQRWIWLDNNLVLIDTRTGVIIDIVSGAY